MNIAPDTMVANPKTWMSDNGESQNSAKNELPSQEQLNELVRMLLDELKTWDAEQILQNQDPLVELSSSIRDWYNRFTQEKPDGLETQWLRKVVSAVDFLQPEPLIKARLAPSIDGLLRSRLTGVPDDGLHGNGRLPTNQQNMANEMKEYAEAMGIEIPKAIENLESLLTELADHSPAQTEKMM